LLLGILMAVEAKLGVVGEIGAELEEEGTEVTIEAIPVEVIDGGAGADDPRIGAAGLGVAASLGAEDGGFFLGFADEDDAFGFLEVAEMVGHEVVFALVFLEGEERDMVLLGEALGGSDEGLGDGIHEGGGSERIAAVMTEEPSDTALGLERGDEDVEVHAVDALKLEGNVVVEDLGNAVGNSAW
jgi:hypothetical protein